MVPLSPPLSSQQPSEERLILEALNIIKKEKKTYLEDDFT